MTDEEREGLVRWLREHEAKPDTFEEAMRAALLGAAPDWVEMTGPTRKLFRVMLSSTVSAMAAREADNAGHQG